jgi:Ca2+/Na+ antiporter
MKCRKSNFFLSFCPSLRVIADSLRLSQNIAGVTFLAFGNGAPDVFSAIAAVGNAKDGDAGLAFGALFGAGVFVSTVIVGIICFISPFYSVQRPLLRDIIFFMIAGFWAFVVVWDGKIALWETLGFLLLYVAYIFVVLVGRYVNQRIKYATLGEAAVRKNDFSSANVATTSDSLINAERNVNSNEEQRNYEALEEYENENVTIPLLRKNHETPDVLFSQPTLALKDALLPFTSDDWTEANYLFKFMLILKVK